MRIYTVHLRRHGLDTDHDLVLVKEGFSWPAFLFTVAWAFWHRMWWSAIGLLAVILLLNGLVSMLAEDPLIESVVSVVISVLFGLTANDLRRSALERCGFSFNAVITGPDWESAVRRYLDHSPGLVEDTANGLS